MTDRCDFARHTGGTVIRAKDEIIWLAVCSSGEISSPRVIRYNTLRRFLADSARQITRLAGRAHRGPIERCHLVAPFRESPAKRCHAPDR